VAVGALAVLAVVAAAVAGYGWWTYRKVDRVELDLAQVVAEGPQNYLVIGSDSRAEIDSSDPNAAVMLGDEAPGGQRSDSIAVLRVDPGERRIDVLSIPRDLWVEQADGEEGRINSAYAKSTQNLIDTLDQQLGIPVNHFVEVDFKGFQSLIDALGGVPMWFDHPVRDTNSGLRISDSGCVNLDGPTGLAFARSRHLQWKDAEGWHSDPSADLGRITRQQLLMRAALGKARTLGLNNVATLTKLVNAGLESTRVDSGLGLSEFRALGSAFSDFDPQRLQTHALAVEGDRGPGGAAILRLDPAGSAASLALFRGDAAPSEVTTTTLPPPGPGDVTVSVYNATGVDGEARRVSYVLSGAGFLIDTVDTAPQEQVRSTLAYAEGGEAMAELVAGRVGPTPDLVEDGSLEPGQVVLTLGTEFDSISETAATGSDGGTSDGGASDGTGVSEGSEAREGLSTGVSAAGGGAAATTSTTTAPGWTPGTPPAGAKCG
jgi:LCP family protein required for cell wall assembly